VIAQMKSGAFIERAAFAFTGENQKKWLGLL
jgi:hypothetical protein